jgi:hypothetical protein
MWPQSSLEEVREAQELADAGDPRYTWQLLPAQGPEYDAEIFTRFLREELGWAESRGMSGQGSFNTRFVRCAPDRTNPLYPDDPRGGDCAPTIDEVRYETVEIEIVQLDRQGPSGIWVVSQWEMVAPFLQVMPPDPTSVLSPFLEARVAGEGAEEHLGFPKFVPFLYSTDTGAPYERSEFEVLDGPVWPDGEMSFKVRLFADDGETVVEQFFTQEPLDPGLQYRDVWGPEGNRQWATVNGETVPVPYELIDGVTIHVTFPWYRELPNHSVLKTDNPEGMVVLLSNPKMGCEEGPGPADALALTESIQSDPDLETTAPETVMVGAAEALRMDLVVARGARACPVGFNLEEESRMRLYVLDLPASLSTRILAIAIVAPKSSFEEVVEAAALITDSIEVDAG